MLNKNGQLEYTCRMIHSIPMNMSAVHVFKGDQLVVVSHLIGNDQLPSEGHSGVARVEKVGGSKMASAEARAYNGAWGLCPQWGPGAKPLVRGSGGRSPPEVEGFFKI